MKKLNYLFAMGLLFGGLTIVSCGGDDGGGDGPVDPVDTDLEVFLDDQTFQGTGTFDTSTPVSGTLTVGAASADYTTTGDLGLGAGDITSVSNTSVVFTPTGGSAITANVSAYDAADPTGFTLTYEAEAPAARVAVLGDYVIDFE